MSKRKVEIIGIEDLPQRGECSFCHRKLNASIMCKSCYRLFRVLMEDDDVDEVLCPEHLFPLIKMRDENDKIWMGCPVGEHIIVPVPKIKWSVDDD